MQITVDKKKIRRRIVALGLLAMMSVFMCISISVMNLNEQQSFGSKKGIVLAMFAVFLILFASLTFFYMRLARRNSWAVRYENGILDDVSKPFNKATGLRIENIVSVNQWSRSKGINQYKIVTSNHNPKRSSLVNQLRGNYFYLTDYVLDSKALFELLEKVAEDIRKQKT